jgi:hypothetical protein
MKPAFLLLTTLLLVPLAALRAAAPAHAATLKRMQGLLHDWQVETQDPFLDPPCWRRCTPK